MNYLKKKSVARIMEGWSLTWVMLIAGLAQWIYGLAPVIHMMRSFNRVSAPVMTCHERHWASGGKWAMIARLSTEATSGTHTAEVLKTREGLSSTFSPHDWQAGRTWPTGAQRPNENTTENNAGSCHFLYGHMLWWQLDLMNDTWRLHLIWLDRDFYLDLL